MSETITISITVEAPMFYTAEARNKFLRALEADARTRFDDVLSVTTQAVQFNEEEIVTMRQAVIGARMHSGCAWDSFTSALEKLNKEQARLSELPGSGSNNE